MNPTSVKREKFHSLLMNIFDAGSELTARECAAILYKKGFVPYPMRQTVHPRIKELVDMGKVEECGSKLDEVTHKIVTIYRKKGDE